eukprot:1314023-Prymnesium_polylepis.1
MRCAQAGNCGGAGRAPSRWERITAGGAARARAQVSDGAAAVLLMSRRKADELGLRPLGTLRSFQVVGVQPDEMGVGPA